MLRHGPLAGLFLLLALPLVSSAQQRFEKTDSPETPEQKKAFELLETVASRIATLRSPENRMALSCVVADLLWTKDEKRGRELFEGVTKDMASVISLIDPSDNQSYNNYSWLFNQRQEIVGRMAQRDPEMALSFVRATRFPSSESAFNFSMERNLEVFLARAIAGKDPERALRLARQSLSRGLSHELGSVLNELQQKSLPAAQSFYESVVKRIKEEDLVGNHEAANIACNLLNWFSPPKANENTYRELLETIVKAALSTGRNDSLSLQQAQTFHGNFSSLMKQVEKYAPTRAEALRLWSQSIEQTLHPTNRMHDELHEVSQNGTVDDLLALSVKYPAEMRSQIHQQAAWKAANSGDANRARQIATELISDPVQKRQVLEQLESQAIWKAINENRIAEARALLNNSTAVEQRIQVLIQLASMLSGKSEKREAIDCLDEVRTLLNHLPLDASRMNHQIQLASSYSLLDPEQGFALMEAITKQLNELVAAACVMDGFDHRYLKNGEWMANGHSTLGNMVGTLRRSLGHFARVDFDRAQVISEQLERPEIRLMAQVDIAQMVLSGQNVKLGLGRTFRPWHR